VAKKRLPGVDCLSLFDQLEQAAIVSEAGKLDRLRITDWQRFEHFETLLGAEAKLAQGLPLTLTESDVLSALQRRTGVVEGEGRSADLILEYTANLARSSYENLKVGERLLWRYITESQRPGDQSRADAYWDRATRLILAAFAAATPGEGFLRDQIRGIVQNHADTDPQLRRLAARLQGPENPSPPPAVEPAPPAPRQVGVGRALHEHTPYLLGDDGPTPVTFADKFLHRYRGDEGYDSFGLWLRPGAIVRIEEVYPAETPRGATALAADHIFTNKHGVAVTLAYRISFDAVDAFWDREMTEPYESEAQTAGRTQGYTSPTVFERHPLFQVPTTKSID